MVARRFIPLRIMDTLDRLSEKLSIWLARLAGLFLVGMMGLACANMTLRAFDMPLKGTFELMGFLGAVGTGLSLAYAQRSKAHISVGLLMKHYPKSVRRVLAALTEAASCGFFLLAGLETADWAGFLVTTGELSETLRIAYHPFVFAAAAGCIAMAFVLMTDFLNTVTGRVEH